MSKKLLALFLAACFLMSAALNITSCHNNGSGSSDISATSDTSNDTKDTDSMDTSTTPTSTSGEVTDQTTPPQTGIDDPKPWDASKTVPAAALPSVDVGRTLFSGNEWRGGTTDGKKNYDVVSLGTVGYHTNETLVYGSYEAAIIGARDYAYERSTYYKLLTGEGNNWQLAVYKNEAAAKTAKVLDNFYKTDYNMTTAPAYGGKNVVGASYNEAYYGGFKSVTLPASWQTQGFDFPIHTNMFYPWPDAYGNSGTTTQLAAPTTTNPVGFYRYYMDVDAGWITAGRKVYINFGGVESAYYLYVNGYEAGYSEDSYDAHEFDITAYLNADGKDNLIAVKVYRWSDGSYFENQDALRLAGIFRDVYVYSTPAVQIFDWTVTTKLTDNYTKATLGLTLDILNGTNAALTSGFYNIDVRLVDAEGNNILKGNELKVALAAALASGKKETLSLSRVINNPHLWSDEDPYLYTLVITLYDKDGVYYGSSAQQLGFREITFTQTPGTTPLSTYTVPKLNGQPLLLRGVNRHDNNPVSGKYVPRELYDIDIGTMKQLNINALRTSHYPDDKYLYYLCDKYGILVMAEANLESHYGGEGRVSENDQALYGKTIVTDRILGNYYAQKNRTSVIIWSMGNETSTGGNATKVYSDLIKQLKALDSTRPVHFESFKNGNGVDMDSNMYPSIQHAAEHGGANKMPYVICEYVHGMGNSLGAIYEYWEAIRAYDNIIGAFIWDYVDHTLYTEIPTAYKANDWHGNGMYMGNGEAWKNVNHQWDYIADGILNADRSWQPEAYEVRYVYQAIWASAANLSATNKTISIFNEYNFHNLSDFTFKYELLENGKVIDSGNFAVSGKAKETVQVVVPYNFPNYLVAKTDVEYALNVTACLKSDTEWASAGYPIASAQMPVAASSTHTALNVSSMNGVNFTENGDIVAITGTGIEITLNKKTGTIETYKYNGETIINNGPTVNFRRAQTSNDNGDGIPVDYANYAGRQHNAYTWQNTTPTNNGATTTVTRDAGGKFITVNVTQPLTDGAGTQYYTYIIYGNGAIEVTSRLETAAKMGELLKYGSVITLPKEYENITFYGNGFWDTYSDRKQGSPAGVYSSTVTEQFVPYMRPQDTGNKTDVRYFALTADSLNTGVLVVAKELVEASALHFSVKQLYDATYPYQLSINPTATYLSVDYGSRGVGTGSCGGGDTDTPLKYRLLNNGDPYEYGYTIVPFAKSGADLDQIMKPYRGEPSAITAMAKINGLLSGEVSIAAARSYYNSLSETEKAKVTNEWILTGFEAAGANAGLYIKDQSSAGLSAKLTGGYPRGDATSPTGYSYTGNFPIDSEAITGALGGTNFTVGVWAKLSNFDTNNTIFAKGDYNVCFKIGGGGVLQLFVYSGGWQTIEVSPASCGVGVNEWHFYTAVKDGSTLKLFVDGNLVGSKTGVSNAASTNYSFGVGISVDNGRSLAGAIGELFVTNTAATAEQVKTQYQSYTDNGKTAPIKPENAVLWIDMGKYEIK